MRLASDAVCPSEVRDGLLFLLALFVGGWVFSLAVGFDDWRAGLTFPMGIMGTLFVPFVIRDVLRSRREDD